MRYLLALTVAFSVMIAPAQAHFTPECKKYRCKAHVIKPYKSMFRSIAACETGNTFNRRITDPSGKYRGLYQFDFKSWRGAGGSGDPISHSYTEQTYRAVIWLHINGRNSWPNC